MIRIHLTIATVTLFLASSGVSAPAQQESAMPAHVQPTFLDRAEILRRIDLYEDAARRAVPGHVATESLVKIYSNLGILYREAGMYLKAEDALRHAVALLRSGQPNQLADALSHLAVLHIVMNNTRQAEMEQVEALKIRETMGDPVAVAESQNDLADVYIREGHHKQALSLAQRAAAVIADDQTVAADSRIAVRETLASALCGIHQCDKAMPLLRDAFDLAMQNFGPNSLSVGVATYLLGNAEWQNGDLPMAEEMMKRGIDCLRNDLGSSHAAYLNALAEYAKLLRQRGELEAASAAQREVRRSADVVDVRSFTARQ